MAYVMVPVPEEFVEEAMATILRLINRGRLVDWDQEGVTALYQDVDEAARSVLALVARATIAEKPLSQRDASDLIEITEREISGLIRELNDLASTEDRPILIMNKAVTQTLPNGRTREARVLQMADDVAEMVQEAERSELADALNPQTDPLSD